VGRWRVWRVGYFLEWSWESIGAAVADELRVAVGVATKVVRGRPSTCRGFHLAASSLVGFFQRTQLPQPRHSPFTSSPRCDPARAPLHEPLRHPHPRCAFSYLATLDCRQLTIHSVAEGSVVFPRVPVMSVVGPLALCQLVESTFLNLAGYSSLVATNAARMRLCAGEDKELLEFGLRRAQVGWYVRSAATMVARERHAPHDKQLCLAKSAGVAAAAFLLLVGHPQQP
jgi:hypothetical protein